MPQLLKPARLEPVLQNEKPPQWQARALQLEKARAQQQRPNAAKKKKTTTYYQAHPPVFLTQ